MAYSNVVLRLPSRLQTFALKLGKRSLSPELSPLKSCSQSQASSSASPSASAERFSRISRLPLELSSVETMIPLHNAKASARLVSSLSTDFQSWSLVPQGTVTLMCAYLFDAFFMPFYVYLAFERAFC